MNTTIIHFKEIVIKAVMFLRKNKDFPTEIKSHKTNDSDPHAVMC